MPPAWAWIAGGNPTSHSLAGEDYWTNPKNLTAAS